MATGKRYYWIKLKESFMTSDAVDFLMGQPDGANYVVLYQMLCLKTINTGGKLERHIGEIIIPYDVEKIQRDTKWFTVDTVRVALDLYKALGLIYTDNGGALCLTDHENLVGSETDYACQKKAQRQNKPLELPVDNVHTNVHTDIEKDIRDKRIDKENRYSTKEKGSTNSEIYNQEEDSTSICTEPQAPPVLTMILNTGEEYPFDQKYVDEMQTLYPAVDVLQEMREMKAWLKSNPSRRKTRRGIKSFVNNWLSREQDRGSAKQFRQNKPTFSEIQNRRYDET